MKPLILQNLTHRGTVLAEGFVFSSKLLTDNEIRRRILSIWQPNAKVLRYQNDLIMLFPTSFRLDCRQSIGLPLVKYDKILASFPLQKSDLPHFQDFGESVVLSIEGKIETVLLNDLQPENISDWFDVSDFQVFETQTLGEIISKPVSIEKVESVNLRDELKDVPKADEKLATILHTLKQKKVELEKAKKQNVFANGTGFSSSSSNFGSLFGDTINGVTKGLFNSLKNLFANNNGQSDWQTSAEIQPKPPSKLRKMFTKAMFQLKIAQIVGREQAKYLAKMMEMFENGDLEEALKHAIPLEDMQALKEITEQMPSFSFLRPRNDLSINYGRQRASSSAVFLENQWFNDLQQLYRQTFDRLVAQNRIEEAAFVLAELLKSNHEAVEFLEKHGKFRLAAELAESRNLSKETIVRQWFLAGEKNKAVQLAILHNSFEYVVSQLEKQNHPQATELREIWAENLAKSGNFPAAINTIWQIESKRELARDWIEKVLEFGGTVSAQMLAKKVTLFPATFNEVKIDLQKMLAENSDDGKQNRAAFAHETLRLNGNKELRTLSRPLIRKLLSDISKGSYIFTPNDLRLLVDFTQDYALRTDLPKVLPDATKPEFEPLELVISSKDQGSNIIYDAILLPDGKIAVALGESGVKILSRQGKIIAHFDQPTQKFIVSDFGTKAICLANRGEVWRLAKIDFVERKTNYWCDAKLGKFSSTFDGNIWFISNEDNVYAIDANSEKFEAVWQVTEIGGLVHEIARSKQKLMLLIYNAKGIEKWWYDLPQFTLRSRNETKFLQLENENQRLDGISSFIAYSVVQIEETVEDKIFFQIRVYDYDSQIAKFNLDEKTLSLGILQMCENKYVISQLFENTRIITLFEIPQTKIAEIILPETENFSVRLDEKYLTVTDKFGRVIIFDHKDKILRKNWRY